MPDLPGTKDTFALLPLPGTWSDRIEMLGDRDWLRLDLQAGDRIGIDMTGQGLADPYLRIFDADGQLVNYDDDSGGDLNAHLVLSAAHTGAYYVEAAAFGDQATGDYAITTQWLARSSPLDALTWGTALPSNDITVYFAPAGVRLDGVTSEGFTDYERRQFTAALEGIEAVADVRFTITTDPDADLRLVLDLDEMSGAYAAYFNPPDTFNAGIGVFNGNGWDRWNGGNLEKGGFGYAIITHELLHGLGLAHPHDTGGSSTIMDGVIREMGDYGDANLNQGIFTTMSYNNGYHTGQGTAPLGGIHGVEIGPMALDIAVLQSTYGANTTYAAGNDTYWLPSGNQSGTGWQAIWDTGGKDTMRYDGWRDATLDLRAAHLESTPGGGGYVSSADGIRGGLTIANGVVIEKARGGTGDDTIKGNDSANRLWGKAGEDILHGRSGNDILYGGGNADVLRGGRGADQLYGGGSEDMLHGAGGGDKLHGGRGKDVLRGGSGDDKLYGGGGADVLRGGSGADILTGGAGADRFDFNTAQHSTPNHNDIIKDFQSGTDILDLRSIDADSTHAGNQAFSFIGRAQFSDTGQLRITMLGGDLYIEADHNGDGQADISIRLLGSTYLLGDDILL